MEASTPVPSSEYDTEEKTEPFPSAEYSRLWSFSKSNNIAASNAAANAANNAANGNIHLDELIVPYDKDIRLIFRTPHSRSVSPGSQSYECMYLRSRHSVSSDLGSDEAADSSSDEGAVESVLAVTQTSKDIKFVVSMPNERLEDGTSLPSLECELYYNPTSDNQIIVNKGHMPITLSRIYSPHTIANASATTPPSSSDSSDGTPAPTSPASPELSVPAHLAYTVDPGYVRSVSPGTWRIEIQNINVLEFRIVERRRTLFKMLMPPPPPVTDSHGSTASGKRSFSLVDGADASSGRDPRRRKTSRDDGDADADTNPVSPNSKESVVMFMPNDSPAPLVLPLPHSDPAPAAATPELEAPTTYLVPRDIPRSHALLEMGVSDTVVVKGQGEGDCYTLTKQKEVASSSLSAVYTGLLEDHPGAPANCLVMVKVVKTDMKPRGLQSPGGGRAAAAGAAPLLKSQEERFVVNQANMFMREVESHSHMRHKRIVQLYSSDARYLTLYMEPVDAPDLSKADGPDPWRQAATDYFLGNRDDARCILKNMAEALHYMHDKGIVHNDVKPGNILYSRDRGALLCDFGLSSPLTEDVIGGTPYYVPPEFIGKQRRGPPSDVWAMGVVMLYVLRKIAYPCGRYRSKQRPLYWQISDVNKPIPRTLTPARAPSVSTKDRPAVVQMQMWLNEVKDARSSLNLHDKVESLTHKMLTPVPGNRITMKQVLYELATD